MKSITAGVVLWLLEKTLEPLIEDIKPNIFCATRCNGMGIAIGSQTGEDVANLLLKSL